MSTRPLIALAALVLGLTGCHVDDELEGHLDARTGTPDAGPDAMPACRDGAVEPCELAAGCAGQRICAGGAFSECTPPTETCNGADDDCDGTPDEGFPGLGDPCSAGVGACAADGVVRCDPSGAGVTCDATAGQPGEESCNATDDDCDGTTDEGFGGGMPCETGEQGVCATGATVCRDEGIVCVRAAEPSAEQCDGLDNDCDGATDEGEDGAPLTRDCYDGPAETVGNPPCRGGTQTCEGGVFGACLGQALPGVEICDAIDNDCDGEADDVDGGCACLPGETRACYTGPEGTADVGACRTGTQTCLDDGSNFGPCQGEVVPAAEVCATRAQDLDCDGDTDDVPGTGEACQLGVGACLAAGLTACGADDRVACAATPGQPAAETCDGIDNDCDGMIDDVDGLGDACQLGVGACLAQGTRVCDLEARALACDATPDQPAAETCDGIDSDCDGTVDDVPGRGDACQAGVGACVANGARICDLATGQLVCDAVAGPGAVEICDAIDNDCDGRVDEVQGLGDACTNGVGACQRPGTRVCDVAGRQLVCDAQPGQPAAETCDGADNDCDGNIDDVAGLGDACTNGVGACQRPGTRVCDVPGRQLVCDAQPGQPAAETCDGADNDCDGNVDDVAGLGDACTNGVGACQRNGTRVCDVPGRQLVCNAQPGQPAAEICDRVDNDCDGNVDDVANLGAACSAGQGICQRNGTRVCDFDTQQLVCNAQPGPSQAETCDNRDQDCDGRTDEAITQACYGGPGGTQDVGTCRAGTRTCNAGAFGACQGEVRPVAEFCSGQDNDCNSHVDDIYVDFDVTPYAAAEQCFDFAIADLNRNGRRDVVCSLNANDGRIAYWLDNGVGTFGGVRYTAAAPARMYKVEVADLDRDGDPDVVGVGSFMMPQVFINDNGNLRAPVAAFASGFGSASGLALADMTGDGIVDIVTTIGNQGANDWHLAIAPGNGNGTFAAVRDYAGDIELYDIAVGDIDADGDRDVFGISGRTFGVYRANGANFAAYAELIAFANFPQKFLYTDLDADGRADVVIGTEAEWIYGRGQGNGFAFTRTVDRGTIMAVTAGDFDCDPRPELVMTRSNPGSPIVIVREPTTQSFIYERGSAHGWGLESFDVNNDGLDDLILPRANGGGFSVNLQRP